MWDSPIGIGSCLAKLTGQEVSVKITEGHPLARCVVTNQFSASGLPLRLIDVVLEEQTGVRFDYLGDAGAVLDDVW